MLRISQNEIFRLIKNNYQSNSAHYKFMFNIDRSQKNGLNFNSYDGKGECGSVSKIIKNYLLLKNKNLNVQLCMKYVPLSLVYTRSFGCCDHAFLLVNNNLIIDGTYKQLFINKSGHVSKNFSSYANYLYASLPPFFIGTKQQLDYLTKRLECRKNLDNQHKNDYIYNEWHKNYETIKN